MLHGISNGNGATLGDAKKRKALYPNCINHGFANRWTHASRESSSTSQSDSPLPRARRIERCV